MFYYSIDFISIYYQGSSCHALILHPGRGRHSRAIAGLKRTVDLTYLLNKRLKHKRYISCNDLKDNNLSKNDNSSLKRMQLK